MKGNNSSLTFKKLFTKIYSIEISWFEQKKVEKFSLRLSSDSPYRHKIRESCLDSLTKKK